MDNPHRVCLILDGLDESKLSECDEFLQKVIRGEELCGIRLVVRPNPKRLAFFFAFFWPFLEEIAFSPFSQFFYRFSPFLGHLTVILSFVLC